MASISALQPDQLSAAAKTLTEAFWDDPLLAMVLAPDEKKRAALGEWFFKVSTLYGLRNGEPFSNEDTTACAIWFPPGKTHIGMGGMLRAGFGALPFKVGLGGTMRVMKALSVGEKFHKAVKGPHWYLMALGTTSSLQGTGLGSALLEVGTAKADAAGVPCYLETGTESNVAFYSKRGFEVAGQEEVLGFTVYGMVRQPQK